MKVPEAIGEFRDLRTLQIEQANDLTLEKFHQCAKDGTIKMGKLGAQTSFKYKRSLLYRVFSSPEIDQGKVTVQLVIPQKFRQKVMHLAHDSVMAGHLGSRKTYSRILEHFFWPAMRADVTRYCQSCDICQRTIPKGRVPKVPLGSMPLMSSPFERVALDLIGPIFPPTDRGNRYILTFMDYATRYPEAVALPRIETERVAESLVGMFSRLGVPEQILTDLGSQFTSDLTKEISRLMEF